MRLHHVGFVVPGIETALPGFTRALGGAWDGRIHEDVLHGVRVAFVVSRPGDAALELVEPLAGGSPVDRFLRENGGGLHHVCYEVDNLEMQMTGMRRQGAMIVRRPQPAVAFNGRRVAWVLTAGKLLIELLDMEEGGARHGAAGKQAG
jgi:methylmalonyl-CoA/ethylmalonyl-CoA epimerase